MRQDERKGAWTLFVVVLLFGAVVWGIGGRKYREDRQRSEDKDNIGQQIIRQPADSVNNDVLKTKTKKSKKSASSVKTKSSDADIPSRDLLSDTIKKP